MTLPLIILAFYSISIGWVGIPQDFPIIGGVIPRWIHEFIGGTLVEHPEVVTFSYIPVLTSILVVFIGVIIGWIVYRRVKAGDPDPVQKALGPIYTLLENKYYFDELYDFLFVRPAYWLAETFSYLWIDRRIIDGFLHWFGHVATLVGGILRNYIDKPIVNGFGDWAGETTKRLGGLFRPIQTGRIQQYMIIALVSLAAFGALFYYYLVSTP
jgi:NADH-quinone oxidoreductase subunit L